MDRRHTLDATGREGSVRDHRPLAVAPFAHVRVVKVGPHLGGALHGTLPRHPDDRTRAPATAGLLEGIESDDMEVRVRGVVGVLVVDREDISGLAVGQPLAKRPCQRGALLGCCFGWKRHDEPFGDTALSARRVSLRRTRSRREAPVGQAHGFHITRRLRTRDVAQVRGCLPDPRSSAVRGTLVGESFDRMPE